MERGQQEVVGKVLQTQASFEAVEFDPSGVVDVGSGSLRQRKELIVVQELAVVKTFPEVELEYGYFGSPIDHTDVSHGGRQCQGGAIG
jgi:hypothetical protein